MYIHLGADVSIPFHTIVGIFDLDSIPESAADTLAFMVKAEKEAKLDLLHPDVPRSLIISLDRSYLSAVSAQTLRTRCSDYKHLNYED
ncbi:MAG TPA: DUF370 domain-containing protein [Fastidiosipila sp.]|jgi:hypothetical protein|nr:DUF370 domain-containing protein [Eubacteriales bacterium]MDD3611427.1 DUF370 domain-containing protein [Eubacteriales bacterium]HHU03739.1 DUF370 domain-containing protein [Fastidiosipila sp.]